MLIELPEEGGIVLCLPSLLAIQQRNSSFTNIDNLIRSPSGHVALILVANQILVTNLDSKPFWSPFGSREAIRSPSGRRGDLVAIWSWHLRSPLVKLVLIN